MRRKADECPRRHKPEGSSYEETGREPALLRMVERSLSTTVGFQETAEQRLQANPDMDSFYAALAQAPVGRMLASQQVIGVREFQRSEHY